MAEGKIYYSVYTTNEKIWIRADLAEIVDGCLAFYDLDGEAKVLITAFPADYWKYMYEADVESGESITAQIPFWKRHTKHDDHSMPRLDNRSDYRNESFGPRKPYTPR